MVRTFELKMECTDERSFVSACAFLADCCQKNPRYHSYKYDKGYHEYSRPCRMIFQCPLYKSGKGCQENTKEDWTGVFEKYDENRN